MTASIRAPYGSLGSNKGLPSAAYKIWLTRQEEMDDLPRAGWMWQQETDPDQEGYADLARKILDSVHLNEMESQILLLLMEQVTQHEMAQELGISIGRVRTLVSLVLGRLQYAQFKLTGVHPDRLCRKVPLPVVSNRQSSDWRPKKDFRDDFWGDAWRECLEENNWYWGF